MTLKTKNAPIIIGFVVLVYVGFAFTNDLDWSYVNSMEIGKESVKFRNPVFSLAVHLLALILTYILPSDWKHRLVYLRWHNPLPGSRAFTELCLTDSRISRDALVKQYGELPTAPDEQNALWYKIYRDKQSDKIVLNSHGRWLLFRDIFTISLIIWLPASIFTLWLSGTTTGLTFSLLSMLLVAGLWVCARNTGIRFACNVIAR